MGCVDGSGNVNFSAMAFSWSPSESIETALTGVFNEMSNGANMSQPQPADGEMY